MWWCWGGQSVRLWKPLISTPELCHLCWCKYLCLSCLLTTCFDPHQISLETERLGPRRVESLRKEDEEWQKKAHAAVLSIQDLTVKFFETTTRAQKGKHTKEAFPHFTKQCGAFCLYCDLLNCCVVCLLHNKVLLTLQPLTYQRDFYKSYFPLKVF